VDRLGPPKCGRKQLQHPVHSPEAEQHLESDQHPSGKGALEAEGRMRTAFAARLTVNPHRNSYESRPTRLDAGSLKKLRANKRAWAFFQAQPPWYRRTSSFWVMEAKREDTRERRLAELIARSAKREPIKLLDRRGSSS
jgi:hypothetical protein